jgi:hypothetical protein
VNTDELCVDDTCVTPDQFAEGSGNQSAAGRVGRGIRPATADRKANSNTDTATQKKPFTISQDAVIPNGIPVLSPSSLFQDDRECVVEQTVERIKEGRWHWGPVMRLTMSCDIPHGLSGGPLLRMDSDELIGVMGTASDGNAAPCEFNNPCEIKADGSTASATKDQGYAHFVHRFYTCLDGEGNIDLDVISCLLPKPNRP